VDRSFFNCLHSKTDSGPYDRADRRMNADALVELSARLDMQAAILAIMGGEQIDVD
jgi:hypothetical protein